MTLTKELYALTSSFLIDCNKNEKVTKFPNLAFKYGLDPVINKPILVTKITATAIDHFITNLGLHKDRNNTGIILNISKEVLYLRWNEHHLSAYFGTLMTQL